MRIFIPVLLLWLTGFAAARDSTMQQGLLLKSGSNIRFGSVQVIINEARPAQDRII